MGSLGQGARPSVPPLRRLAWLLLGVLLLVQAAELWDWHLHNDLPGRRVCCDYTVEAVRAVRIDTVADLPHGERWHRGYGLLPQLALPLFHEVGPDGFGLTVGLFALLLSLLAFDIARQLAGVWSGLFAASLVPVTPVLAFAARRWDTHLPLATLAALGVWLLLRSQSLTRPLWTAALAGLLPLVAVFTSRETDNLLVLAVLASATALAALRGLLWGTDAVGTPVARWRVALGVLLLGGLGGCALQQLTFTSPEGAAYYLNETAGGTARAGTTGGLQGALAYLGHLYWRGLTPPLGVALEAGVALWLLRRGRGRAELAGWALVPFVALSLLPKRNHYYPSPLWGALPVLVALGVAAIPGRRWFGRGIRVTVGVGLVAYGTVQLADRRGVVETQDQERLSQHRWLKGNSTWGGAFQTTDDALSVAAWRVPWLEEAATTLAAGLPADLCACRSVALTETGEISHLSLAVLEVAPCLETWTARRLPNNARMVAFVGDERTLRQYPKALQDQIRALPLTATLPVNGRSVSVRADAAAPCPD